MTLEEALDLIAALASAGIRIRQHGRLLIAKGAPMSPVVKDQVERNWTAVARAASAYRQGELAIERAARRARRVPA